MEVHSPRTMSAWQSPPFLSLSTLRFGSEVEPLLAAEFQFEYVVCLGEKHSLLIACNFVFGGVLCACDLCESDSLWLVLASASGFSSHSIKSLLPFSV